ncbi:hypothetical protein IGB42_01774 [Andreprevotia sp. IGB-42]|uniref:hypothetical protein n=1 Tax=Andreprevotia sp. IGB-42 TaxID=2497473 RepID=UPI00135A4F38|nr:hypothetical protein [Andreprevotia sp. IGB-42]KAF0813423.1 hypothetical protein IGB42_01774 [Andreprevotia sp. IGB-42]
MKYLFAATSLLLTTTAFAGEIPSVPTTIAREVITSDSQTLAAPAVSFRFSNDIDAQASSVTFQMQYTLDGGAAWKTTGNATHIKLADGVVGTQIAQGSAAGQFKVDALKISGDGKTLFATLTVNAGAAAVIRQPVISIAASGTLTDSPTIGQLKQLSGTLDRCDTAVKVLKVSIKHYLALSDPQTLANDSNATASEHLSGSPKTLQNLLLFSSNLLVIVGRSGGNAALSASNGYSAFVGSVTAADDWIPSSFISSKLLNLGFVRVGSNAHGYDLDLTQQYLLNGMNAAGISATANAAVQDGHIEAERLDVEINASPAPASGSKLFLSSAADCSAIIPGSSVSFTNSSSGPIQLSVQTGQLAAALSGDTAKSVYICYDVTGASSIPSTNFTVSAATLVKAAQGNALMAEQNNRCDGSLYNLAGSIKIDIRNYAADGRSDGWISVLRVINASETRNAEVYGQYILANGKYGKWGKLLTLAPRAVAMLNPTEVATKLVNAPTAPGASEDSAPSALGAAPRLRITSETTDSLRVQNYLYNPLSQNFIEASGTQGADLITENQRIPAAQLLNQDAQFGLNGGR